MNGGHRKREVKFDYGSDEVKVTLTKTKKWFIGDNLLKAS